MQLLTPCLLPIDITLPIPVLRNGQILVERVSLFRERVLDARINVLCI
jgi:hypothetical protein